MASTPSTPASSSCIAESFESERQKRIQIAKQDDRDFALLADAAHDLETITHAYVV